MCLQHKVSMSQLAHVIKLARMCGPATTLACMVAGKQRLPPCMHASNAHLTGRTYNHAMAKVEDVPPGPGLLEHIPHGCLNASWLRKQDHGVHVALHSGTTESGSLA